MDLQLQRIRKAAGLSQDDMANALGIKKRTYASWERKEAMLNLEQAYYCAIALNCTIDEIAGMPPRGELSQDERELVDAYRDTHDYFKPEIVDYAERIAERHPKNEAVSDAGRQMERSA